MTFKTFLSVLGVNKDICNIKWVYRSNSYSVVGKAQTHICRFGRKLKEQKAGVWLRSGTRVIYTKIGHVAAYHLTLPQ
jgi:hypothetical protein